MPYVAPTELEGHLLGNSSVPDVRVSGVPNESGGVVLIVFVTLNFKVQELTEPTGGGKNLPQQITKISGC